MNPLSELLFYDFILLPHRTKPLGAPLVLKLFVCPGDDWHACVRFSPRFMAEMQISSSGAVFKVLEANGFKYLNHLSLRFQTANDDDLKSYLSACVKKLKVFC